MAIHVNDNETYVVLSHFPNLAIHEAIKRRRRDNASGRVSLRHLFTLFTTILGAAAAVFAQGGPIAHITYDVHYGDPNFLTSGIACSNGANGMMTKGE